MLTLRLRLQQAGVHILQPLDLQPDSVQQRGVCPGLLLLAGALLCLRPSVLHLGWRC